MLQAIFLNQGDYVGNPRLNINRQFAELLLH